MAFKPPMGVFQFFCQNTMLQISESLRSKWSKCVYKILASFPLPQTTAYGKNCRFYLCPLPTPPFPSWENVYLLLLLSNWTCVLPVGNFSRGVGKNSPPVGILSSRKQSIWIQKWSPSQCNGREAWKQMLLYRGLGASQWHKHSWMGTSDRWGLLC